MNGLKDKIVTVFGGTGFIGQNIVAALIKEGAIVRVPSRLKSAGYDLRTGALVGQVIPMQIVPNDPKSFEACVDGADYVINLIAILAETPRQCFDDIHVDLAANIAKVSKKAGVKHLIHISALGADKDAESRYQQTKARGEEKVFGAFPEATVLRPSIVFGEGDGFFSRFARMARLVPMLPLIGGGKTLFQPVFVGDLVDAMIAILQQEGEDDLQGQIIECAGPETYSFEELLRYTLETIDVERPLINVPYPLANIKAWFWERLPGRILTRDQIKSLKVDNVLTGQYMTLEDIGIVPTPLEVIVPDYLESFRTNGQYANYRRAG